MNWLNANPFLRAWLPFAAGIAAWLLGYTQPPQLLYVAALYLLCVLLWMLLIKRSRPVLKSAFGLLAQVFLVVFGWGLCDFHDARRHAGDVSTLLSAEPEYYSGYVSDLPAEKKKTVKAEVTLQHAKVGDVWRPVSGKVIVYLEKDSAARLLQAGGRIVFSAALREVSPPLNPNEFDYKKYLALKNIFYTAYLPVEGWTAIPGREEFSLYTYSQKVRQRLLGLYRESGLSGDEFAMVAALVLGYDDEIDQPLMNAYSHTGTLHVLSVSGLHVGIIYLMLSYLLGFLDRKRLLKWLKVFVILTVLWFFVLLAGFSAPAVRAALMFSLILVGKTLFEHVEVTNIVFAAAFFSLCYNPFWLGDVGFQLSYLAVLGIILLYPRFYTLFTFSSGLLDKIWALCSVSIAAQIATLPLTLYYFHQLPVLFLLTNLVLIPASTLIMYGGMLILLLSKIPVVCSALVGLTGFAVKAMNATALYFDSFPFCVIDNINLSLVNMILMYVLIGLLYAALDRRSFRLFAFSIALCVIMCVISIAYTINRPEDNQLVIYHADKSAAMQLLSGNTVVQLTDTAPDPRLAAVLKENFTKHDGVYLHPRQLGKTSLVLAGAHRILYCQDGTQVSPALLQAVKPSYVWVPAGAVKRWKQRKALEGLNKLLITGKVYKVHESLSDAYYSQNKGAFILSLQP